MLSVRNLKPAYGPAQVLFDIGFVDRRPARS